MRPLIIAALSLCLFACAGKIDYTRPTTATLPGGNTKIIERAREQVWNASVPELGKRFFVINNLDKSSGLMNLSYTGDPERYIDCGHIMSYVKNAAGERTYNFRGAKAQQWYEIMVPAGLFQFDRRMNLEGRVNLIFEEIGPTSTRVTANTRYVVTRTQTVTGSAGQHTSTDSITFNSGGRAAFPSTSQNQGTECVASNTLENEILSAVQ